MRTEVDFDVVAKGHVGAAGWRVAVLLAGIVAAGGACGGSTSSVDAGPSVNPDADPSVPDATPGMAPSGPDASAPNGLSDEFNGASLDTSWKVTRGELFDETSVANGELQLVVSKESVWYHGDAGPALWKGVAGDFKATTSVHVHMDGDPSRPPGSYQFGGLIAFDPDESQHNYVFAVVGPREGLQIELKTTVDNQSEVTAQGWGSTEAELRICRVGDRFRLYTRTVGSDSWGEPAISYDRPDLPGTLNVGPFAYSLYGFQTMRAKFARFYLEEVGSEADCAKD
ncbi:hypothetical protein [Haliangium sp.]|uniref:hypothetical protein n=1 Tax=Haliangium sp. TaxID=2663208 RepID=UPI003D0D15C8